MVFRNTSQGAVLLFLTISSLLGQTRGQLAGCGSIPSCSSDSGNCYFGPHVFTKVGVAGAQSSLTSDGLTWTVGVDSVPYWGNKSTLLYDRTYIIGSPPTVSLSSLQGSIGCALFLNAANSLAFNGGIESCGAALGDSCASELLDQAKALAVANDDPTVACSRLGEAMRNSTLPSCAGKTGSWKGIESVVLTGPSARPPTKDGTCKPSTGDNYQLTIVSQEQQQFDSGAAAAQTFANKITPILTIFFPSSSNNTNGTSGAVAAGSNGKDASIVCVRPVSAASGRNGSPRLASIGIGLLVSVASMSSFFGLL